MEEENKYCRYCHKYKEDTRFEGLVENFICDECLYKIKGGDEQWEDI